MSKNDFASVRDILVVAFNIIEGSKDFGYKLDKDDLKWANSIKISPKLEKLLRGIPIDL